jgi:zinc D-Ala-D-Ala carboxypeptidase
MKLSKNLSLREVVRSTTAKRLGLKNEPDTPQITNLKLLANHVFQPLRDNFEVPIYVSSGYRSTKLNNAIGGSSTSQHCQGRALDLDADVFGKISNAEIFHYIKDCLDFDQLIWEFGDDTNPDWVHVSYTSPTENRGRVLKAYKDPDYPGTTYRLW